METMAFFAYGFLIWGVMELRGARADLQKLTRRVERVMEHHGIDRVHLEPELVATLLKLVEEKQNMRAYVACREATGLGLAEAKEAVEALSRKR